MIQIEYVAFDYVEGEIFIGLVFNLEIQRLSPFTTENAPTFNITRKMMAA